MGEFATYAGRRVKIGTCDNMYYLRADQAGRVQALPGNVDPVSDQEFIRFRFPWPSEDNVPPGGFEDHAKSLGTRCAVPDGVRHYSVQFKAPGGYLVSMECPESGQGAERDDGLRIGRNGYPGATKIVQQAHRNGHLCLIAECNGCGAKFNLPTLELAQPFIDDVRSRAESLGELGERIAERIAAGYAGGEE